MAIHKKRRVFTKGAGPGRLCESIKSPRKDRNIENAGSKK